MSFPSGPQFALSPDPNVCPECQAAGLTACAHRTNVGHGQTPKPVGDLSPGTSAALLKAALLGALAGLGYLALRSGMSVTEECESETGTESPFDAWEPNQ